jgi:hypothetical protein
MKFAQMLAWAFSQKSKTRSSSRTIAIEERLRATRTGRRGLDSLSLGPPKTIFRFSIVLELGICHWLPRRGSPRDVIPTSWRLWGFNPGNYPIECFALKRREITLDIRAEQYRLSKSTRFTPVLEQNALKKLMAVVLTVTWWPDC